MLQKVIKNKYAYALVFLVQNKETVNDKLASPVNVTAKKTPFFQFAKVMKFLLDIARNIRLIYIFSFKPKNKHLIFQDFERILLLRTQAISPSLYKSSQN